jgi:DNA (cytosine-5)-methyltransferase 1
MNELSLFTGIGGGLLGTKLLGWKAVGYVEWDKYCCRILEQRIKDEILDDAPVFNIDIREFNQRIAAKYRGLAEVITAGFPCQPFSVAGKRRGDQDERNMWPATIECIRLVRPRHLLLENVPGLLTHEYVRRIYGDLAESGYHPKWRCLSAAEVGANHKRNRWFLVGDSEHSGWSTTKEQGCTNKRDDGSSPRKIETCKSSGSSQQHEDMANSTNIPNSECPRHKGLVNQEGQTSRCDWWQHDPSDGNEAESRVGRLVDGIPDWYDRIKAIGNGQVPLCVATAYALLSEEIVK